MAPKIVKVRSLDSIPHSASRVILATQIDISYNNTLTTTKCDINNNNTKNELDHQLSVTHLIIKRYNFDIPFPPAIKRIEIQQIGQLDPPQSYKFLDNYPPNLSHLTIRGKLKFPVLSIPPSLTYLNLGYSSHVNSAPENFGSPEYTAIIANSYTHTSLFIPPSLTFLEFWGSSFLGNTLPVSLTHLTLGHAFIEPIALFPPQLKFLKLGALYNQCLDNLPSSLQHLTLGRFFTIPITTLPPNLTHFNFGSSLLKHPLECLPRTLTHLTIGNKFNHPLPSLPHLVFLQLGDKFNTVLPVFSCLQTLHTGKLFGQAIPHCPSLVRLSVAGDSLILERPSISFIKYISIQSSVVSVGIFPPALIDLSMNRVVGGVNNLPQTLINLSLGYCFNQTLDNLPNSILSLTIGNSFNRPIDRLPPFISSLTLGDHFNLPADDLPSSLLYLSFGRRFNQKVDNLPSCLRSLSFGEKFNQQVAQLPHCLLTLKFGHFFNQSIATLPLYMTHLELGTNFR